MLSPLMKQCYIISVAFLVAVSNGAALGYPTVLLFQLRKNDTAIEIDLDSASWIGSVHGLAGILSIVMPTLMQWKGRQFGFITASTFVLLGWILSYFANSVSTIIISECLHGFGGSCLFTITSLYISEMVSPEYRNIFIQAYNIIQCLGLTLVGITIRTLHWRFVSLVFSVPLVVGIVMAFTLPESPFWLAWKGKIDKCENNFLWLRGNDEESLRELKELIASQKENRQINQNMNTIKRIYGDVTSKDCYKPGIHMLLLFCLDYLGGGMVLLLYFFQLIQRTTNDDNVAFISTTVNNSLILVVSPLSGVFVKYFKNKTVLLTTASGCSTCLLLASIASYLQHEGVISKESYLILYCLMGTSIMGCLGMYPIACATTAELMPVRYRGIGGCLTLLYTCMLHAFTLKIAPYLFLYIDLYGTFLLYSCNIAIISFLVWKFVPETKNRTLQEIENFYMYGKFESRFTNTENEQESILSNNAPL